MSTQLLEQLRAAPSLLDRQEIIDQAHRAGLDLSIHGVSLDGYDLSGLWMTPLSFVGVDFRGCVCRGATLAPLTDCILDGVDARDSSFSRLEGCRLRGAKLDGACLSARIAHCDFADATLRSARIEQILTEHKASRDFHDNSFAKADLRAFDAAGGYLVESSFVAANCAGARLSRADLTGCDCCDVNFAGSNLVRAQLRGARLANAKFERCVVSESVLRDLEAAGSAVPSDVVVALRSPGPATRALEREIEPLRECELRWDFVHVDQPRRETLLLWREKGAPLRAGASRRRNVIRSYRSNGSPILTSLMLDVMVDYVDWQVDLKSVKVEVIPKSSNDLWTVLVQMLSELFFTA
jgi:uncharacterized protein YjbI with pentapeptide repeats